MDYEVPHQRKSKNDKKAKSRYNRYKRGGSWRIQDKGDRNECKKG